MQRIRKGLCVVAQSQLIYLQCNPTAKAQERESKKKNYRNQRFKRPVAIQCSLGKTEKKKMHVRNLKNMVTWTRAKWQQDWHNNIDGGNLARPQPGPPRQCYKWSMAAKSKSFLQEQTLTEHVKSQMVNPRHTYITKLDYELDRGEVYMEAQKWGS